MEEDWKLGVFSACSWSALVAGVGGYVLAGVEIGGLSCIFLYFCGLGWWAGGCLLYARTHTNCLDTFLLKKVEDVTTISKLQPLTSERIID